MVILMNVAISADYIARKIAEKHISDWVPKLVRWQMWTRFENMAQTDGQYKQLLAHIQLLITNCARAHFIDLHKYLDLTA